MYAVAAKVLSRVSFQETHNMGPSLRQMTDFSFRMKQDYWERQLYTWWRIRQRVWLQIQGPGPAT